jgi:hypothetical protein
LTITLGTYHPPHDGFGIDNYGRPYEGPAIAPYEIWFYFDVHNEGPDEASVKLKLWPDSFHINEKTGPIGFPLEFSHRTYKYETEPECPTETMFRCTLHLEAGESFRMVFGAVANTPGDFSIWGQVTPDVTDPDTSNNQTQIWDEGVVCLINGTEGSDRIIATGPKRVSVCGGGGNDYIVVSGSADRVFGERGNDLVFSRKGGALSQRLDGGPGRDTMSFHMQNERVVYAATSYAGGGARVWGFERVIGTRFNDYMTGDAGMQKLFGVEGDDDLAGRGGRDLLVGGPGNDDFISRDGDPDRVRGGPGDDECQIDRSDTCESAIEVEQRPFYLEPV